MEIASLIVAIIALLVGAGGLIMAIISNGNSKRATEISNRPYLVPDIKKQESGNYFDIVKSDSGISWNLSFMIENKGLAPATNISVPSTLNFKDQQSHNSDHTLNLNSIVLGPSGKYQYSFSMVGDIAEDQDADTLYQKYVNKYAPVEFKFLITYQSLINVSSKYKTEVRFLIKKDFVEILSGTYE